MQSVELDGVRFVYEMAGAEHEKTIFTIHGGRGAGDHNSDFRAYKVLADRYRVISYDQRGHGKSSLTPPFTFAQLADDLETLRKHFCGDRKCIVIGGSFGGMIALTYAVRHPDSLSHLVLRGTMPSHDAEEEALEIMKARSNRATSASREMMEKIFSDTIKDDTEFRLIWLAIQPLYFEKFDPNAALESVRTMDVHAATHNALYTPEAKASYDVRGDLGSIRVPTFVVVGLEDWICPPSQSRIIAAGIPGAKLLEVPGANHPVHIEKAEIVMPAIRRFLEGK